MPLFQKGVSYVQDHGCGLSLALSLVCLAQTAFGFCGFYVAKADTKLFNKASQVVMVRNDEKTVLTMANDYSGDSHEFAMVVPVPTFLERDQIHVGDKAVLDQPPGCLLRTAPGGIFR